MNILYVHPKLSYLRLGKHVQTPTAYFPISWDTNQIMSILGPNNIYTVHWVLGNVKYYQKKEFPSNKQFWYSECSQIYNLTI